MAEDVAILEEQVVAGSELLEKVSVDVVVVAGYVVEVLVEVVDELVDVVKVLVEVVDVLVEVVVEVDVVEEVTA